MSVSGTTWSVPSSHIWQFKRARRYQGEAIRNGVPTVVIFDAEFNGDIYGMIGALLAEIDFDVVIFVKSGRKIVCFYFCFQKWISD